MHSDTPPSSRPSSRRRRGHSARRSVATGAVAVVAVLVLGACAGEADDVGASGLDPASATIDYRFGDSSVPPEYHRSYTITVQDGEARMVVDSYGDVLHDVTETVDDATWADLLDRVAALEVRDPGRSSECDGGTSRELRATDAEHPESDPSVLVHAEVCGGEGGDDADAIDAVIEPVLGLFDAEELLATD